MTDLAPGHDHAHLTVTPSSRGFAHLPALPGAYGGDVCAYESSSASGPHVWLRVEELDDLNGPEDGPRHTASILLDTEVAWQLADQLRHLVEHHYQGNHRPDWSHP